MRKLFLFTFCYLSLIAFALTSLISHALPPAFTSNTALTHAQQLNKRILALGFTAYNCALKKNLVKNNLLTIIDYTKPSNEKRLWVIDMKNDRLLFNTLVAHGKYSGDRYAKHFSNTPNSFASSIGVFVTEDSYRGKHGYSLRLKGLEKGVNNNALKRTIVMHKAWYANPSFAKKHGRLGRSWGCFALPEAVSHEVIDDIKDGSVVFAYYPNQKWLSSSEFLKHA
jgi:hypothetical protein